MTDRPPFLVIQGSPAPDTPLERSRKRTRRTHKPAELAQCPRCSGREFVQAKTGVLIRDGKPTGGTAALLCTLCLMNGERVVIT